MMIIYRTHEDGHALKAELKTLKFYQITKKNEMYKKIVKWLDKAEGFKLDVMVYFLQDYVGLINVLPFCHSPRPSRICLALALLISLND